MQFDNHAADVAAIVAAVLAAAEPGRLVRAHLRREGDELLIGGRRHALRAGRCFLLSVGKAAVPMALAAADVLGAALVAGSVVGKGALSTPNALPLTLQYHAGDHPIPAAGSLAATEAALTLLRRSQPGDVLLCLISGGTSALLTQPRLALAQWQALTDRLLRSGCSIDEFNRVRRALDGVKAGGLAAQAAPAAVIALLLSDVIGNDLAAIGSGPTVPTALDSAGALAVLDHYRIWAQLDGATATAVRAALAATDRPPPASPPHNVVIGDVWLAAQAAADAARRLGFSVELVRAPLTGDAATAGQRLAQLARTLPRGHARVYGGETTVTVHGDGYGGRNQALALAAVTALADVPEGVVVALATDGDDGVHPADRPAVAGAYVSGATAALATAAGLDPLAFASRSDSYSFFAALGVGHLAAAAGTNVNDVTVVLRY